ncbi:Replication factor C subunit 1 protein [Rutstroemia sp. NJR-2017a WRK4]|nr:Replication factor C subunit 1 protein [Rutstroemia sp. NJR-2017a WRK4]
MPPKAKPAAADTSKVYAVVSSNGLDSIHASLTSANARLAALKSEGASDVKVDTQSLQGGSVTIVEAPKEKAAPKSRAKPAAKKAAKEEEEDDNDEEDEDEAEAKPTKANTAVKKTKPVAEQRAANAEKGTKDAGSNLPANIKALLAGSGDVFSGKTIVVTGVPPTLGRKNAETLVKNYGGKLTKALSKNTSYVVVGNDAGPKKLEQIESLGVEILDEEALIEMLESGGGEASGKRSADEDEEDEEEEEKPAKKRTKKAKA